VIADNLKIKGTSEKSGIEIVENIMRDIVALGLFSECQGRIFCLKLLKRISLSMTSSQSFRDAINGKKAQYHDSVMIHHDPIMTHADKVMLPVLPTLQVLQEEAAIASAPKQNRFRKPELEEIATYCQERQNTVDPRRFLDHYESNGWKVGKNPMKDWKAAVRTWEATEPKAKPKPEYKEPEATKVPDEWREMLERTYKVKT